MRTAGVRRDGTVRFIDTEGLKSLRDPTLGPWRLGEDRLLRGARLGWTPESPLVRRRPLSSLEEAQGLFDAYRAAWEADVGSPEPYEVVELPIGYGVVVAYVPGMQMNLHIGFGSYTPEEAGTELGALARRLREVPCDVGIDWGDRYRSWARGLARLLPTALGEKLVHLADDIPETRVLLHGDLHTGNMVVSHGVVKLVDMESLGYGHPLLELATMRSRLWFNSVHAGLRRGFGLERSESMARALWDAVLRAYLGQEDGDELGAIDDWAAVLAEVEHCCFSYDLGVQGSPELTKEQQMWLTHAQSRLAELLPRVDTLAF